MLGANKEVLLMGGDVLVLPAANRFTVHFEAAPAAATAGPMSSKRRRRQDQQPWRSEAYAHLRGGVRPLRCR